MLYGDNDEYQGNKKPEQKALYGVEGHFSYTINFTLRASLDATYDRGGETKIDGTGRRTPF